MCNSKKRRRKKREYRRNRRSKRWHELQKKYDETLAIEKEKFFNKVKSQMIETGNSRNYFRAAKALSERSPTAVDEWEVAAMFPGEDDAAIAEKIAEYFNRISSEYTPLTPENNNCLEICPQLHEISSRLKNCKKPKSKVAGDIDPKLVNKYHDLLAIPLHFIFKSCYATGTWPALWSSETVTVIPKCTNPTNLSQLRNLSCTPLFSKVMESFLLEKIRAQSPPGECQFGGIKGSSVDHFLIESWHSIFTALEDPNAAAAVASIDFEKAFNRVCHHQCIAAARRKGMSEPVVNMIKAFLTGRSMSVKVGEKQSRPRTVDGGSPQESIMGNALFCLVTEIFETCKPVENSFEQNGVSVNLSSNGTLSEPPSPIARPDFSDIQAGEDSDEDEIRAENFFYFAPIRRIEDSVLSTRATQAEIDARLGVPENWAESPLTMLVYVDDMNCIEKVKQVNAVSEVSEKKRLLKTHATKIETFFEEVSRVADDIDMKVNQSKTQLLCISAAINDNVVTYMRPKVNGTVTETESAEELKILGFWFNGKPTVCLHVRKMCESFRAKLWAYRRMKKAGMPCDDLLVIYKTVLRPVLEFACVTYGPMLTAQLSEEIERLQLRVMKIIYGIYVSYATVLNETTLESLGSRRENLITNFALKTVRNPKFTNTWFPLAQPTQYNTRHKKKYAEIKCRTDRMYKSPIYTMRRILNANC